KSWLPGGFKTSPPGRPRMMKAGIARNGPPFHGVGHTARRTGNYGDGRLPGCLPFALFEKGGGSGQHRDTLTGTTSSAAETALALVCCREIALITVLRLAAL